VAAPRRRNRLTTHWRLPWLKRPIPVHIVYDTAWVDEPGVVEFRKDIYGRDGVLQVASTR
jgi:murein L,D-transpeptidase YcbB/YkuD